MKKALILTTALLTVILGFVACGNNNKPEEVKENGISVHGFTGLKPEHVYYASKDNGDGTFTHNYMVSSIDFEALLSDMTSNPLSIASMSISAPAILQIINITTNSATLADGTYDVASGAMTFQYMYLTEDLNFSSILSSGSTNIFNMNEGKAGQVIVSTNKENVRAIDFNGNSAQGTLEVYYAGEYKDGSRIISLMNTLSSILDKLGGLGN
ncbi:MAG: hypothetical protein Q4D14_01970 [Bacteroidales bacterium]|nr:hypothetical protein [Bacteroidales bacterium]